MTDQSEGRPLPWERQPGESLNAYEAFCRFRDALPGERDIPILLAKVLGREPEPHEVRTWSNWKYEWKWVVRAKAWQDELDRLNRERQRDLYLSTVEHVRHSHLETAKELRAMWDKLRHGTLAEKKVALKAISLALAIEKDLLGAAYPIFRIEREENESLAVVPGDVITIRDSGAEIPKTPLLGAPEDNDEDD